MAAVFRIVLLGFVGALLAMLFEPFWSALFLGLGIDLSKLSPGAIIWIKTMVSQVWFVPLLCFVIGLTLGAWLDALLRRLDALRPSRAADAPPQARPDTRLRIRVDASGTFHQVAIQNIDRWQQVFAKFQVKEPNGSIVSESHQSALAITFVDSIDYERPILNTFGHPETGFNYYSLGPRGAMFQFLESRAAPEFEIWFPPPGHYAAQSKIAASPPLPTIGAVSAQAELVKQTRLAAKEERLRQEGQKLSPYETDRKLKLVDEVLERLKQAKAIIDQKQSFVEDSWHKGDFQGPDMAYPDRVQRLIEEVRAFSAAFLKLLDDHPEYADIAKAAQQTYVIETLEDLSAYMNACREVEQNVRRGGPVIDNLSYLFDPFRARFHHGMSRMGEWQVVAQKGVRQIRAVLTA